MTFGIKKATFGTFFLIIFGYEVRWAYLANKSNKDMDSQLQQIAQYYMLHGRFLPSLGLFDGKMGLVLFFFHYSRYIQNPLYEEFAGELLDEVLRSYQWIFL